MKKKYLLDLVHRVSQLTSIATPVIVGSQSLFAITDDVPDAVRDSIECDFMLASGGIEAIQVVNETLGIISEFSAAHGYYADGLGLATVVLVPGWEDRLQPLIDQEGQVVARCLELHDAAVSKLMAGREKDFDFISALLDRELVSIETLMERAALIQNAPSAAALLPRLRALLNWLRKAGTHHDLRPLRDLIDRLT